MRTIEQKAMKKTYKFTIPQDKEVLSNNVRIENGQVLVDVEFKEKYQFKFGDIVVIENPECQDYKRDYIISIYPDKETPKGYTTDFFDIVCIDMDGKIRINPHTPYKHRNVHLADASDKKELFDKLAEVGKRWNEETKQLEDIRWRAEKGEYFYYVENDLSVCTLQDSRGTLSDRMYKVGNYFRTPEAAKKVADQIKDIFKNSKVE